MQSSERSTRSTRKFVPDPSSSPEKQSESDQFLCMECSETFQSRAELNSHRQSHVTRKQFTCSHCGRGFHHQVFLQMHERSHEDTTSGKTSRVISTRSSKPSDVVHVRPTKPQHLLNSLVDFKSEPQARQTFTPREFLTRRSHGAPSTAGQDDIEKSLFELRISKFSDTTVHVTDSFGNSIEILTDVFHTYTIGTHEEDAFTKTCEESPVRDTSEGSEEPSVSPQTKPKEPEKDVHLSPSRETSESIASETLPGEGPGLPVPAPSALKSATSPEHEEPGSETVKSDEESVKPSSVSQDVHQTPTLHSVTANEDDMDTSPEEPKALLEVDHVAEPTLTTSASDKPISQDRLHDEKSSILTLTEEPLFKDQSPIDDPGSVEEAPSNDPKTSEEHKQPDTLDVEQDLTSSRAESGQVLIPSVGAPPERDISPALAVDVPACSLPLERRVHAQPGPEDVGLCNTLSINRDLPAENKSIDLRSGKEDTLFTLSEEDSERIGVGTILPEKDLRSLSIGGTSENNMETDTCMTYQDVGEVRTLQVDNKDPEKHCGLLAGQDILHDNELVIDDKREEDLFERDIFPLGAPMEVCEKGLASIEEQSIVCGGETHRSKMEKESDICLNGSDMTYISESEMIKLLEQDKDDLADDEPTSLRDMEITDPSQKIAAFSESEVELNDHSEETKSSRSPTSLDREQNAGNGIPTNRPSDFPAILEGDTAEVTQREIKLKTPDHETSKNQDVSAMPTGLPTPKEKMGTDSFLPEGFLTNEEPRADIRPQPSLPKTSSSSNLPLMTTEDNPDITEPGFPCGDSSFPGTEDSSEHGTLEENNDVFVTVEDNESDDNVQPIEAPRRPSRDDAGLKSGHEKPDGTDMLEHTSRELPHAKKEGRDLEPLSEQKTTHVDKKMENLPGDVSDLRETMGDDTGDHTNDVSSEKTDLKNEAMKDKQVEQDTFLLLKENKKRIENDDVEIDAHEQTPGLSSHLDHFSKTLSNIEKVESKENYVDKDPTDELRAANIDLGSLEGTMEDVEEDLENPRVASIKAIDSDKVSKVREHGDGSATSQVSDVLSVCQSVCQESVKDSLEDSELIENDPQEDEETPSKPLGVVGECIKCGRKLRRGRKELVWLPVCFKCRKAAKKQERISNQETADDLDLEPLVSRREETLSGEFSESRNKRDVDSLQQSISDDPKIMMVPLVADDENEALASASKKMYKCPKCDESFKIPALLAGHIKCHTLPQCLTCGCQMRLKYKTKRIPRRCQKCCQQLKEKMREEKEAGEGSEDEDVDTSEDEDDDAVPLVDIDDDVLDEDSNVDVLKAKRKSVKVEKSGSCEPDQEMDDDVLVLSERFRRPTGKPLDDEDDDDDDEVDSLKKVKKMSKKQESDSSDDEDTSEQNLGLPDGEKPRLCPQCGKAFPCNRSLNLHLLSHTGIQCESCGCRLAKRRRGGRWSKKCRGCRLQSKGKAMNDSEDETGLCSDKIPNQMDAESHGLKARQVGKNAKIQSMIKKKKELKWMNMLLAVKGLMDKSRKKKEKALEAAQLAKKNSESSEAEKCDGSSGDNAGVHPDLPTPDPHYPTMEKAGPSKLPCPPNKSPSGLKRGRKCLYREKNIIKVEENEVLPYIPPPASSISTAFIKQEESWQCLECNQSWPNSEALVNHQHSHTSGQSFTCEQCPQVFSSEQYLNIHVHAHDEERPFRCPECDKTFSKRNHLGVHMRVHTGSRPFACPDCPCRFRQKVTLIAHRYSHRNYQLLFTKPFQCSVCSKSFKQKERLVVHERLHTGECPFSCKDCDKVFPSKARLYVHRKLHKICEGSSSIEQSLGSQEVSDGQPFKCQECGKVCSTKASFVLHCKVHRLSSIPVQSIKREQNEEVHPFTCIECNKVFSSKASLAMHLRNHCAQKATAKSETGLNLKGCFPCKDCDKVCSTKASLILHRKVHKSLPAGEQDLVIKEETDTPNYICKDCNKVCSTKASLVLHCKVHKTPKGADTETPPFRCKDCNMVCSTKASFVLHSRVHSPSSSTQQSPKAEAQLYNCKHCDMVCSTKASFALHSKVHRSPSVGEQNLKSESEPTLYDCKHCDMVCSTKASFVLHSKVHRSSIGEQSPKVVGDSQSYNCKHCDMVCSTKASFVLHSKVHRSSFGGAQSSKTSDEPRPFSCMHCDMVCSTKASFVLHSKVHRSSSSVSEQSSKSAEDPPSYNCKECDMVFSTKASFVLHSKVHKRGLQANPQDNTFTCKDCDKVCSTKGSFVLHRKVHASSGSEHVPKGEGAEPPFPCKDCNKTFSSKGRLSAHSKVHEDSSSPDQNSDDESSVEPTKKSSDEKPFSCAICGLRFIRLKMLVRHKAVHGERSVTPCIHCGKRFLYMKSLFNHIKICQSKSKGKKLLLKKAAAKRKVPKDGAISDESTQKKLKTEEKQKALTTAQKLKNKNLTVKAKKGAANREKGKGKGPGEPKTREKGAKLDNEGGSEGEGKKTIAERPSDGRQEKPSEQTAKEPAMKKNMTKIKKVKKEPGKEKQQNLRGPKKWGVLAASTVRKKNLQAILIGGKKKLLVKKKVQVKPKAGGKAVKD